MRCGSVTCTEEVDEPHIEGWRFFEALWYCLRCYKEKAWWM